MNAWPAVTCLCPTYGRFERLRDALACWLLQDYPGERRLVILNDAMVPLRMGTSPPGLSLVNARRRFPTLGHKRQVLLELARGPLVAHWDDDDLYLPWHLRACVEHLGTYVYAACVKPRAAWFACGLRGSFSLRGPTHNVYEGQMVFRRAEALKRGGYPPLVSGQAKALLDAFRAAGRLYEWEPAPDEISYVYRWGSGVHHVSGGGDTHRSHAEFGRRNNDFGVGRSLLPEGDDLAEWAGGRLRTQFRRILALARYLLNPRQHRALRRRLSFAGAL